MSLITVFTPTYNRKNYLSRLYESLKSQTCFNFEWLVIDDGSEDETFLLFEKWTLNEMFDVKYVKLKNGGKQRAINEALKIASGDYFFIVDSDDFLESDCIQSLLKWFEDIDDDNHYIGVSGVKGKLDGKPLKNDMKFGGKEYIDCSNLERAKYGIDADMAEAFKTSLLRQYSFPVWADETFTPECVVWDQMALDGYILRWYSKIIYRCEYLPSGLTNSGYSLYIKNLMGCAMAENVKLKQTKSIKLIIGHVLEILVACTLKKDYSFLRNIEYPIFAYILFPVGYCLAQHRKKIIKRFI